MTGLAKISLVSRRNWEPGDKRTVDDYLDTVREVERRIQRAEQQTEEAPLPDLDRPAGVPPAYADHARLMFDLQVLAIQGDITRVATVSVSPRDKQPHVSGNRCS